MPSSPAHRSSDTDSSSRYVHATLTGSCISGDPRDRACLAAKPGGAFFTPQRQESTMGRGSEREHEVYRDSVSDEARDKLLAATGDVLLTLDESGTIQSVTDEAPSTLGYSSDQLAGQQTRSVARNKGRRHRRDADTLSSGQRGGGCNRDGGSRRAPGQRRV